VVVVERVIGRRPGGKEVWTMFIFLHAGVLLFDLDLLEMMVLAVVW